MLRITNDGNLVISACLLLCLMAQNPCPSIGTDTLSKGDYITESHTLISKDGIFELGFFTTSSHNTYLGIWYKDFPNKTVVWVANREHPLPNTSGLKQLKLAPNGNLELYHDLDPFWSTSLIPTLPETVEAVLLDDGNLILRDGSKPGRIFWQSFDHPTDTWLAGAGLGRGRRLVSWKSTDDPSPGPFSMEMSSEKPHSFFLMWKMLHVYWRSGDWNVSVFSSVPELSYLYNFSFPANEYGTYIRYSVLNPAVFSMVVLDSSGNLMQLTSLRSKRNWSTTFQLPEEGFGFCGDCGENGKGRKKMVEVIIAVVVPVVLVFSGGVLGCFYTRRNKHKEGKEDGEDLLSFEFELSVKQPSYDGTRNANTQFDLPMFNYASVSAAANNFTPENKLGEGGFGPVYKGKLLNGLEVAMKRLSKKSRQGFEEFRNEILLIAKLQHRNLVRLLGCCIHPDESILIYEYMPNKSLDLFLFDSTKQELLDWPTRVGIVEGIAQGLLYLHEYSRVRIIHRDLKASNILLDAEMNPKISDFGMARIFGGNDSLAQTNKIVGTYGYMAPEYALQGLSSIKSDVFSFGVLVLEIISGKKNTGFYQTDSLNLLGYTWDLWISGRGVELVDDMVGSPAAASTALRYINVGLLCVQENPNERPNMSSVVSMLSSEIAALPPPNKPAFAVATSSSSSLDVKHSVNGLTVSTIEPR